MPSFAGLRLAHLPSAARPSGCWRRSSAGVAVVGILLAAAAYLRGRRPAEDRRGLGPGAPAATGWTRPTPGSSPPAAGPLARFAADTVDQKGVDGLVNGVGVLVRTVGERLRPLQTGFVRQYGLGIVAGAVALLAWFLSRGGF